MNTVYAKRLLAASAALSLLVSTGCGYLLYPERQGQEQGRVDPVVVALDAASLLFGIIPGVVAFAVDLSTGTIYLPPGEENVLEKHQDNLSSLFYSLPMQPAEPVPQEDYLAEQLSQHLGVAVDWQSVQFYRAAINTHQPIVLEPLSDRMEVAALH